MNKHLISRAFFGGCVGITIGQLITILISFGLGEGEYLAVIPQFGQLFPTERAAMLVQNLWLAAIGITFAEAALIFEAARWGALLQFTVHFLVTGGVYLPFLVITNLPLKKGTAFLMLGSILLTYGIAWGIQAIVSRRSVARINAALERKKQYEQH